MADKTIWEYPTLMTAQPDDLILMASDEETYNMEVQTLKDAMGEAASKPPIVRNGNWWTWSAAAEDYVDSGTAATGPQGPQGTAAGFGTVSATVDNTTGTPSVDVTTSGASTPKNFAFAFHNIKGDKGDTGNAAGFGTVSATVDSTVGTPSVDVTTSGSATAKNFAFAFHNIKGEKGDPGEAVNTARYTTTIPITGWTQNTDSLYTTTVSVQGVRATDNCGMVLLLQTGTESTDVNLRKAYNKLARITAGADSIIVYSMSVPDVAIPIQITVIR